jgi:hypothetical protein
LSWLQQSVRSHRLIINDAKAFIHTVGGTAFLVTRGFFNVSCTSTRSSGSSLKGSAPLADQVCKRALNVSASTGKNLEG